MTAQLAHSFNLFPATNLLRHIHLLATSPRSDANVSSARLRFSYRANYQVATFSFRLRACLPHIDNRTSHRRKLRGESGALSGRSESRDLQGPNKSHILFQRWAANRIPVEVFASARGCISQSSALRGRCDAATLRAQNNRTRPTHTAANDNSASAPS
jgi:hypothetical protein